MLYNSCYIYTYIYIYIYICIYIMLYRLLFLSRRIKQPDCSLWPRGQCVCVLVVYVWRCGQSVWTTILSYYRPAAGCLYLLPCAELSALAGLSGGPVALAQHHSLHFGKSSTSWHSWVALNFWPLLSWTQSLLCNPLIRSTQEIIMIKKAVPEKKKRCTASCQDGQAHLHFRET